MDNDTTGKIPVVGSYDEDQGTASFGATRSSLSDSSEFGVDDGIYDNDDYTVPLNLGSSATQNSSVLPETWLAQASNKGTVSGKVLCNYLNEVGHDKLTLYSDTKGHVFVLAPNLDKDVRVLGIANNGATGIYSPQELVSVRKDDGFILMEPYFLTPDNYIRDYTESKDKSYGGNTAMDLICIVSMLTLVFVSMFVLRHTYQLSPAYLLAVLVPGLIVVLTNTDIKERLATGVGTATVIGVSLYTAGVFN